MEFNGSILSTIYASTLLYEKNKTGFGPHGPRNCWISFFFIHNCFWHTSITYAFLIELGNNSRTNRSSFVNHAFIFHLLFPFASTQRSLFIVQSRSPNSVQCSLTVHTQCDLLSHTFRSEFVHRSCWKVEHFRDCILIFVFKISEILKSISQKIY